MIPTPERRVFTLRVYTLILSCLFGVCAKTQLCAQYNMPQNKFWAFALNKGLNFMPGPAPVSSPTSSNTQEGTASVADNAGNLLFYTGGLNGLPGARVYDRTGAVMPNGAAIVPFATYSSTQGAAIVPVIGNPNQYYVFSLEQGGAGSWGASPAGYCRLYYCIVDMTLNSGLGDVIASTIATPLDSGLCEKMTVVAGDNCDIWLLTHKKDLPHFKAYNISSSGISAPVVSTATGEIPTGLNAYKIGTIKVSPDRTMIANCVLNGSYGGGTDRLELLQFNAGTGIVTGCQVLNLYTYQYDAEFSPDNSKLYSHIMGSKVYQYDLSLLPSLPAVVGSEFLVTTTPDWGGQMKLGPNGKIYLQTGAGYVDCINSPNLAGAACSYTYHAINVGAASTANLGMPNMQIVATPGDTIYSNTDTTVCASTSLALTAPPGSPTYVWSTGATTASVTVTAGTYWVRSVHGCDLYIDTFHVASAPLTLIPTATANSFCTGSSATLTAPPGYTAHVWSTGATTSSIVVTAGGTYRVADTNLTTCTLQIDTFHVTATPLTLIPIVTTTNFCPGSSATLTAPPGYAAHVWSTGATTSSITVTVAGTYRVADTNLTSCTLKVDTFHVTASPLAVIPITTPTSFCAGTSATLTAPPGYATHTWSTGATTSSITVTAAGTWWVSDLNLSTCALQVDTFQVTTNPLTVTPIVTPTSFCAGSSAMLTAPAGYATHVWNTGATTSSVTVTTGGTWWVSDINLSTCAMKIDTFHVTATPLNLMQTVTTHSFCEGTSVTLFAPVGYIKPVWNTGATALYVTVAASGTWWVSDTVLSTCTLYTNNFYVTARAVPAVELGNNRTICIGDSIVLSAPTSEGTLLWNTGSTASTITVKTGGIYHLTVTKDGCSNSDVIIVNQVASPSPISLGRDTVLCAGEAFVLRSGLDAPMWSTGVAASSITVTTSGTYSASVTNECGTAVAVIKVDFEPCNLTFPSGFTPNNDGLNDIARAIGNLGAFSNYRLSIYNRWGERVYYTENIYDGWDGTYKGIPADLGTYFWMMTYSLRGNGALQKGDLTLVR